MLYLVYPCDDIFVIEEKFEYFDATEPSLKRERTYVLENKDRFSVD